MLDIDGDETLEYRGYLGSVEYSIEDKCYHGKIYDIEDLVSYEGETIEELMADFRNAVDDYRKEKKQK
jgi:predicted HicB family RNase H-like nuclease